MPETSPTTESEPGSAPPIGRLYQVGARRLFLHRSGTGGPTVLFLPGAGMIGLDYLNLHDRLAERTTSVVYDRGGTGWSDRVELPRAAAAVVDELHDLLRRAELPGPYLLVGHSLGGFYVRRFAQRFPAEVAGIVLLDPAHEDYSAYMPEEATRLAAEWRDRPPVELGAEQLVAVRGLFAQMLSSWPDRVREAVIEKHLARDGFRISSLEGKNFDAVSEEVRRGGAGPDVPTLLFIAMGIDPGQAFFMSPELLQAQNEGKRRLYLEYAASLPRGEARVLDGAAHSFLHVQQPDAVVRGIHDVLDRAGQAAGSSVRPGRETAM